MKINSVKFIKGAKGTDKVLEEKTLSQVAFIGRSNVGKSSVINSLLNEKNLARTSSFPGKTQQINIYLINNALYFIDLPGYGYAKASAKQRYKLRSMVNWYLFLSGYKQKKVVLIIDAKVGPTKDDWEIFQALQEGKKDIIILANKIDKLKPQKRELKEIKNTFADFLVIAYSAKEKWGRGELLEKIL